MREALISVIVPVYNVETYIRKCVSSITEQTYSNIEIILVDDGSTDYGGKLCDALALEDMRIRVLHKPNGGLSDARNVGLDAARGDYIAFVDSDDYIHPQMLQLLYEGIVKNGAQLSVCGFKRVWEGQNNKNTRGGYREIEWTLLEKDEEKVKYMLGDGIHIAFTVAWNKLYKKELFAQIRYPVGKLYEDEFTTYKLLHRASVIAYTAVPLYFYVQRSGSIMQKAYSEKNLDIFEAFAERLEWYDKQAKYDWYCALLKIYRWRILHCISRGKETDSGYKIKLRKYKKYYNNVVFGHLKILSKDKKDCIKHLAAVLFPQMCIRIKSYGAD